VSYLSPKNFVIFYHPNVTGSLALAEEIVTFINERGAEASLSSVDDEAKRARANEADMLIALGGDGTMLRVGRIGSFKSQPVLGINLGRLGFTVDVQPEEWSDAIERVLRSDYRIEERFMLHASHVRGEATLGAREVLNEVAVARGSVVRPIRLHTMVDGDPLATYVADGLIVATPTGSTAYAMAAGGPVMPPSARNIILVPLAPHLSPDRPVVLLPDMIIEITVRTEHQAVFSVDGQTAATLQDGDIVRIRASRYNSHFVRMKPPAYFYKSLADRMARNPTADKAK
jgi:NAD+ kinase